MTEDQAHNKWCPLTKPGSGTDICIASECMMWRWQSKSAEENRWSPRQGYCGLADKPSG